MSAFWKGVRSGIIYAWMLAGIPAAIAFGMMGHWVAWGLCTFGFILSTFAKP